MAFMRKILDMLNVDNWRKENEIEDDTEEVADETMPSDENVEITEEEVLENLKKQYYIAEEKPQKEVDETEVSAESVSGMHGSRADSTSEMENTADNAANHREMSKSEAEDGNIVDTDIQKKEKTQFVTESVSEEPGQEPIKEKSPAIKESRKPLEDKPKLFKYIFPSVDLLDKKQDSENYISEIEQCTERLKQTFEEFGVNAEIIGISYGARFTRFEIQIGKGVRIRDVLEIEDDIKLNLEAANLHIEAPIPGRTTIGIDVENKESSIVTFREMIESKQFREFPSNLAVTIGKDIVGDVIVESLENMCHLLIGGTTGSGKSVCINSIIMSILYKAHPNDVKLILIDTKATNLFIYNGIPHLLIPVVTDLGKATSALRWCIAEMTDRYRKFADFDVRDLAGYNMAVEKTSFDDEPLQKMPSIVVIIDDFSDLTIGYNNEVEESVCRLAQIGRACGIHLIISTQRPSVNIITGMIKANIPSRIAFSVFSAIDSRTILDIKGAENLLSNGDMLFYPQGARKPFRVQGTFVSDEEIGNVIGFIKNQMIGYYGVDYEKENLQTKPVDTESDLDPYFIEAGRFIIEKDKASIGMIQRVFKIGFNRAARIMDQLVKAGVVGPEEGTKPRRILMSHEQFEHYLNENI